MAFHCKLPPGLARIHKDHRGSKKRTRGFKVKTVQAFGGKTPGLNKSRNPGLAMPLHPPKEKVDPRPVPMSAQQRVKYNRVLGSLLAGLTESAKARHRPQLHKKALAEAMRS